MRMGEEMEKRNRRTSPILTIQEEERERIARDIHDGLGQSLSAIKLKCELLKRRLRTKDSAIKNELGGIVILISEALQDLSRICFDLQPLALENSGFISALGRYVESFSIETGINTVFFHIFRLAEYDLKGVGKLFSPRQGIQIFRIVQEALHNVWKHSKADKASVSMDYNDSAVYLAIADNGIGFDVERLNRDEERLFSGRGLFDIRERMKLLNGTFHLSSQPGRGTKIGVEIPYETRGGNGENNNLVG